VPGAEQLREEPFGALGHYAGVVVAEPGRCWRMVLARGTQIGSTVGHPTHCEAPVRWKGRWKYRDHMAEVWSCDGHAGDLPGRRALPQDAFADPADR
jgi:hypothetical protein